jgi:hypothetical protein
MSDLSLNSVNWQDGMLITQQHLKDQEKYFEELISWHGLDIGYRYGLVTKSYTGKTALSMNLSLDGSLLRVEILRCHAMTPNGQYIEINDASLIKPKTESSVNAESVPVYLGIDPRAKKPVGDPDPEEDIPRLPYLVNQYTLSIADPPNLPEGNYIQIAQLNISGNEVLYSDSYYPPSISISADERLVQSAADFRNRLENLLALSSRAFMAMASEGALANETTTLQAAYRETMYLFVYRLASTLDEFSIGRNSMHPFHMVILFRRLFRVVSSLLNIQPGLKDYLNERYFSKERGSEVGQFMALIDSYLLTDYNHLDIGRQIKSIDEILDELRGLFGFLAQTKREQLGVQAVATETLTYKGRTYKVVDYAAPRVEQIGELSYLMIDVSKPRPISDTIILMSKDLFGDAGWARMQVRLGLNEARGLGETDPVDVDTTAFGNKVALHPQDLLQSQSVRQVTLIFRGADDPKKFSGLGKTDLIVYAM